MTNQVDLTVMWPKNVPLNGSDIVIRQAELRDKQAVIGLDERTTGIAKPDYWDEVFARFARQVDRRFFLVAEDNGTVLGCILGEIRAWEFNSVPCGWVITVSVEPQLREAGIGTILYAAISECFKAAGITRLRTMIPRENTDLMAFFRAQGMMAGPFVQLEKDLE